MVNGCGRCRGCVCVLLASRGAGAMGVAGGLFAIFLWGEKLVAPLIAVPH